MIAVALCAACMGCSKYEDEKAVNPQLKTIPVQPAFALLDAQLWTENFDAPYSLTNSWHLFGDPQPSWLVSAYGRDGLFDNNGPSPTKNYAVSKRKIGSGLGFEVQGEVMLEIQHALGSCVCPGIAVSKEMDPVLVEGEIPTGISMRLVFAGYKAFWFDPALRGHTWFLMDFISDNENVVSSGYLQADDYADNWHTMKIEVTPTRYVKFTCDGKLIWAPFNRLHPDMMTPKNVVLGYTSDGNAGTCAGVAYHNWIKVLYQFGPQN